jgi:hypothetical protein
LAPQAASERSVIAPNAFTLRYIVVLVVMCFFIKIPGEK